MADGDYYGDAKDALIAELVGALRTIERICQDAPDVPADLGQIEAIAYEAVFTARAEASADLMDLIRAKTEGSA